MGALIQLISQTVIFRYQTPADLSFPPDGAKSIETRYAMGLKEPDLTNAPLKNYCIAINARNAKIVPTSKSQTQQTQTAWAKKTQSKARLALPLPPTVATAGPSLHFSSNTATLSGP